MEQRSRGILWDCVLPSSQGAGSCYGVLGFGKNYIINESMKQSALLIVQLLKCSCDGKNDARKFKPLLNHCLKSCTVES